MMHDGAHGSGRVLSIPAIMNEAYLRRAEPQNVLGNKNDPQMLNLLCYQITQLKDRMKLIQVTAAATHFDKFGAII